MDEITPQSSVQADSNCNIQVIDDILCEGQDTKKRSRVWEHFEKIKLQIKLNVSIVVRFTVIMQEKQVLHLCFIIYIVVNPIWRVRIRMTYLN